MIYTEQTLQHIIESSNMIGDGPMKKYMALVNMANIAPSGIFAEIGFRRCTGMLSMILGRERNDDDLFIAIDPYGNIPYFEGGSERRLDYTNTMRISSLHHFYSFLFSKYEEKINFSFWNMESSEFINVFANGVPDYFTGTKVFRNDYAVVHLDGQHTTDAVQMEIDYFAPKILSGGFMSLDNTEMGWMDMTQLEDSLTKYGFVRDEELTVSDKWTYKKI